MVLNEAAQRLGVSLRQTEDQLMRDMLASTSAFVNCTNGTNGRGNGFVAVVKSSLIDLELLAA
jgi:3-deoxy-D-arabino-heptulosonate 7-phosphate (DAHP) synthase